MDANEFFLEQYEDLYSIVNEFVLKGLTEEQMRRPVEERSLVWLLWHTARWQDFAMRVIDVHGEELLDDDWLERMNTTRRDLGDEMTCEECAAFNAQVDVDGVRAYWAAIRQRVKAVARALPAVDWKTAPDHARLQETFCGGLTSGMAGKTRAWWLSFTVWHSAQHLLGGRECVAALKAPRQGGNTCTL